MRIIFLIQTLIGIMGNSSLLCLYIFPLITGHHMRPIDLILSQLVLANIVVLLSKDTAQALIILGWTCFLNDAICKLIFYLYRVGTGVSFSSIYLFSGFQAIKLNPKMCRWIGLKIRSLEFIVYCCLSTWFLHLLMNLFIPFVVHGPLSEKNTSVENTCGYCSWKTTATFAPLFNLLYFSSDIMSLIFMIWASTMVVIVLLRHKRRVRHTHGYGFSSRDSHEAKATLRVLTLVSFFTAFYSVYISLILWLPHAKQRGQWVVNTSVLLASCFPAFSPYVLIISDTHVYRVFCVCRAKHKAFS